MKKEIEQLLTLIGDYRSGEIEPLNTETVKKWLQNFPEVSREPILLEIVNIFGKTYINKAKVTSFLKSILELDKLVGKSPKKFWQSANVLDIQGGGNSQKDFLEIFKTPHG
jgi:hypothetical protein